MKEHILLPTVLVVATCLGGQVETVDSSPFATGGDYIRRITIDDHHWSYVHVFTNASQAAEFTSKVSWPIKVRYLVVGGGGAGGNAAANKSGGGGGGGGGVVEVDNVAFPAGLTWNVFVGKGAVDQSVQGGLSVISNGVKEVCAVPGGGCGGHGSSATDYVAPTSGAGGGGGAGGNGFGTSNAGAAGTFASYVLGMTPPQTGYSGGTSRSFACGGGGGAGGAGEKGVNASGYHSAGRGGEGLTSDITGGDFVYGSGGGGGSINGSSYKGPGGAGGTNAGNGGGRNLETTKTMMPTDPVPNSGAGGGGGCGTTYNDGTAGADGIVVIRYDGDDYPCAGGDYVTRIERDENRATYIHVFTNVQEVANFVNRTDKDLKIRYLVVGGGGAGGSGVGNYPGGGGGGGGVAEAGKVPFVVGSRWTIRVGAGSTEELTQAGSSSISNGVNEICAVPGGGSGGRLEADGTYSPACVGAAGGGGATSENTSSAYHDGAKGTFASYVLGMTPSAEGYSGGKSWSFFAGGGGGAGAVGGGPAGSKRGGQGGEGLASDITGEMFVYGSGGGGGAVNGGSNYGPGGDGGTNAGNGGGVVGKSSTESGTPTAATKPVPNSGAGGGGGSAGGGYKTPTMGADGIVVIRYDYRPVDPGIVLIVR